MDFEIWKDGLQMWHLKNLLNVSEGKSLHLLALLFLK